jgi:hypothetical protein
MLAGMRSKYKAEQANTIKEQIHARRHRPAVNQHILRPQFFLVMHIERFRVHAAAYKKKASSLTLSSDPPASRRATSQHRLVHVFHNIIDVIYRAYILSPLI